MGNEQDRSRIDDVAREPKRFSPYAIIHDGPVTEGGEMLAFFQTDISGAVAVPAGVERRRSPRFSAREHWLRVGWWIGSSAFHTAASYLENISQGGARVRMLNPPSKGELVWLCLGVPKPAECVRAKVLEIVLLPSGEYAVRVAFGTPCPANFYRIAVLGDGGEE
jgi:hypothetical protein